MFGYAFLGNLSIIFSNFNDFDNDFRNCMYSYLLPQESSGKSHTVNLWLDYNFNCSQHWSILTIVLSTKCITNINAKIYSCNRSNSNYEYCGSFNDYNIKIHIKIFS